MVGAANHVRDAHIDVVNPPAELIHRLTEFFVALSGAQQHEILDFIVGKFALAKNRVEKFGRAAGWHAKTNRRLSARSRRLAVAASAADHAAWARRFRLVILRFNGVVAAGITLRRAITQKRAAIR